MRAMLEAARHKSRNPSGINRQLEILEGSSIDSHEIEREKKREYARRDSGLRYTRVESWKCMELSGISSLCARTLGLAGQTAVRKAAGRDGKTRIKITDLWEALLETSESLALLVLEQL